MWIRGPRCKLVCFVEMKAAGRSIWIDPYRSQFENSSRNVLSLFPAALTTWDTLKWRYLRIRVIFMFFYIFLQARVTWTSRIAGHAISMNHRPVINLYWAQQLFVWTDTAQAWCQIHLGHTWPWAYPSNKSNIFAALIHDVDTPDVVLIQTQCKLCIW